MKEDQYNFQPTKEIVNIFVNTDGEKKEIVIKKEEYTEQINYKTARLLFLKIIKEIITLSKINQEHGFSHEIFGDTDFID